MKIKKPLRVLQSTKINFVNSTGWPLNAYESHRQGSRLQRFRKQNMFSKNISEIWNNATALRTILKKDEYIQMHIYLAAFVQSLYIYIHIYINIIYNRRRNDDVMASHARRSVVIE